MDKSVITIAPHVYHFRVVRPVVADTEGHTMNLLTSGLSTLS